MNLNSFDRQYHDLCALILHRGVYRMDRTGTGTISLFGHQMRFDLSKGFPLLTTKKIHIKSVIHELLWFLQGSTNIKYLKDNGVSIWDEWADENGDLGPVYGKQWRSWPGNIHLLRRDMVYDGDMRHAAAAYFDHENKGVVAFQQTIDQISNVISSLRKNPFSRRHIVTAWNPAEVDSMALPPCHTLFQFGVTPMSLFERVNISPNRKDFRGTMTLDNALRGNAEAIQEIEKQLEGTPANKLNCQLYMRSVDVALGMPFNIASYALLTQMVAQQTDMAPGDFVLSTGDTHIYSTHVDGIKTQLERESDPLVPRMVIEKAPNIFSYKYEDFSLQDYFPKEKISFEVAV